MLRFLTGLVFVATLCVAGVLYKIKYDARSLQREVVSLRKQIAVERQQLAVLKAEWSILTHPRRIDQFARELGLAPLSPEQILSFRDLDALPFRQGQSLASLGEAQDNGFVAKDDIAKALDRFSETYEKGKGNQ